MNIYTTYYRSRGWLQAYLFIYRFRWTYPVGLAGLVIGVYRFTSNVPISGFELTVALLGLLCGALCALHNMLDMHRNADDHYAVKLRVLPESYNAIAKSCKYTDFEHIVFAEHAALYSESLNRLIDSAPIRIDTDRHRFRLNSEVNSIVPTALHKSKRIIFNSLKVRMASDITPESVLRHERVKIQKTDYFSSCCTNDMIGWAVRLRKSKTVVYDGMSYMINGNALSDLSDSECSNDIGISTLVFTRDGYMILPYNSMDSAKSPGKLAPASGSADWKDLKGCSTLQEFVIRAMEREMVEECGLRQSNDQFVRTHLTGYARYLNLGGKPEYFGVSIISDDHNRVTVARKEGPFTKDHKMIKLRCEPNREAFIQWLNDTFGDVESEASFALFLSIRFLQDYIRFTPQAFDEIWRSMEL
ncbi:MAG: hypothetical protein ABFD49_11960 [Armatimonadota bacterium]|nr:hypothetical protein [bacterium]